jgi:hypothetical protein
MIGDTHNVATVAKVLGNTKVAIHADEDAASLASQGIGDAVAGLMK